MEEGKRGAWTWRRETEMLVERAKGAEEIKERLKISRQNREFFFSFISILPHSKLYSLSQPVHAATF